MDNTTRTDTVITDKGEIQRAHPWGVLGWIFAFFCLALIAAGFFLGFIVGVVV